MVDTGIVSVHGATIKLFDVNGHEYSVHLNQTIPSITSPISAVSGCIMPEDMVFYVLHDNGMIESYKLSLIKVSDGSAKSKSSKD